MKPLRDLSHHIFATFSGFTSDRAEDNYLYDSPDIYGVDINRVNGKLKRSPITGQYSYNISGGLVVPNLIPSYRGLHLDGDKEICGVNVGDFNSLYPRSMQLANICQSTAGYSSHHAMRIGNKFYNPYNLNFFSNQIAPIKINENFIGVAVFLIRGEICPSIFAKLIEQVIQGRNQAKKNMALAQKNNDHVKAQYFNILQNNLKCFVNTMYGSMLKASYPTFRPFLAALITYYGRLALLRFFFTVNYYMFKHNKSQTFRILGGDTDSLFIRCTKSEMTEIITMFNSWPANRNIYAIAHEKTGQSALFLNRKQYLIYCGDGAFVCKSIFKQNQNIPSKKLFERYIFMKFVFFRI